MNPLPILAAHAAGWRDRPWPDGLEHHARRALLDWFAAMLPGTRTAPATLLAAALTDAELDCKFRELALPVLGVAGAETLLHGIRHGQDLPGVLSRYQSTTLLQKTGRIHP